MINLENEMAKANVLIEALPYIQKFNRKIIVVKYGGSAMLDEELKKKVIEDVVLLKLVGFKPIIVHGGGKEISKWVEKSGMEPRFVNGLRVTDAPTMEIAEMVLNKVNKSLVSMVEQLGVKACGISGKDGAMLKVTKKLSKSSIRQLLVCCCANRPWSPQTFGNTLFCRTGTWKGQRPFCRRSASARLRDIRLHST